MGTKPYFFLFHRAAGGGLFPLLAPGGIHPFIFRRVASFVHSLPAEEQGSADHRAGHAGGGEGLRQVRQVREMRLLRRHRGDGELAGLSFLFCVPAGRRFAAARPLMPCALLYDKREKNPIDGLPRLCSSRRGVAPVAERFVPPLKLLSPPLAPPCPTPSPSSPRGSARPRATQSRRRSPWTRRLS